MTQKPDEVDVDGIVKKNMREWEKAVGWFDPIEEKPFLKALFTQSITEALAGRWAKDEDVLLFLKKTLLDYGVAYSDKPLNERLAQFKKDRGIE